MNTSVQPNRRGITMAETLVASLLIGLVLVSTIQIVGPMVRSNSVHADRLVAANLANELSEEIATKLWTTPVEPPADVGKVAVKKTRSTFDSIDDYQGWSSTPPMLADETVNTALAGWTRSVKVVHCLINAPDTDSATPTGLKRVTVTVSKDGVTLARVISLHAQWADRLGLVVSDGGS